MAVNGVKSRNPFRRPKHLFDIMVDVMDLSPGERLYSIERAH
jgi:hypothetical protein